MIPEHLLTPEIRTELQALQVSARSVNGATPVDHPAREDGRTLAERLAVLREAGGTWAELDELIGTRPGAARMRLARHGLCSRPPSVKAYQGIRSDFTRNLSRRSQVVDLAGQVFGKLTVIERVAHPGTKPHWTCLCECGNYCVKVSDRLKAGDSWHCGCVRKPRPTKLKLVKPSKRPKAAKQRRVKPVSLVKRRVPASSTPEYASWTAMKDRCDNPGRPNYRYYGGRGITYCDLGPRPDGTTLDRIDGDGNYEPGNCRWADRSTQNLNRKSIVRNERQGRLTEDDVREIKRRLAEGSTQAALAAEFQISTSTIYCIAVGKTWRSVA